MFRILSRTTLAVDINRRIPSLSFTPTPSVLPCLLRCSTSTSTTAFVPTTISRCLRRHRPVTVTTTALTPSSLTFSSLSIRMSASTTLPTPDSTQNDGGQDDDYNAQMRRKAHLIQEKLETLYPTVPQTFLNHSDPYTLLVAVLLSAQTTDVKVNEVTETLFALASTPITMRNLGLKRIQDIIKPIGLANTKAKNIFALSSVLLNEHNGQVPDDLALLEKLPGVGRKTASVVLIQAFNKPAFPVDTHIHRLACRWGAGHPKSVVKTEETLKKWFPDPKSWATLHLRLIMFGRDHCPATRHDMKACPICAFAAPDEAWKLNSSSPTKFVAPTSYSNPYIIRKVPEFNVDDDEDDQEVVPARQDKKRQNKKEDSTSTSGKPKGKGKRTKVQANQDEGNDLEDNTIDEARASAKKDQKLSSSTKGAATKGRKKKVVARSVIEDEVVNMPDHDKEEEGEKEESMANGHPDGDTSEAPNKKNARSRKKTVRALNADVASDEPSSRTARALSKTRSQASGDSHIVGSEDVKPDESQSSADKGRRGRKRKTKDQDEDVEGENKEQVISSRTNGGRKSRNKQATTTTGGRNKKQETEEEDKVGDEIEQNVTEDVNNSQPAKKEGGGRRGRPAKNENTVNDEALDDKENTTGSKTKAVLGQKRGRKAKADAVTEPVGGSEEGIEEDGGGGAQPKQKKGRGRPPKRVDSKAKITDEVDDGGSGDHDMHDAGLEIEAPAASSSVVEDVVQETEAAKMIGRGRPRKKTKRSQQAATKAGEADDDDDGEDAKMNGGGGGDGEADDDDKDNMDDTARAGAGAAESGEKKRRPGRPKKMTKQSGSDAAAQAEAGDMSGGVMAQESDEVEEGAQQEQHTPRGRGRPRKKNKQAEAEPVKQQRGRGRPKKNKVADDDLAAGVEDEEEVGDKKTVKKRAGRAKKNTNAAEDDGGDSGSKATGGERRSNRSKS